MLALKSVGDGRTLSIGSVKCRLVCPRPLRDRALVTAGGSSESDCAGKAGGGNSDGGDGGNADGDVNAGPVSVVDDSSGN